MYQAFLSATDYHRWHSPVAGTIVRAFVQDGTYYSEADSEGVDATESPNSQSYLAHVACRAIILIQADDPVIGLIAFVPVGMSDVSSCIINPDITPRPPHRQRRRTRLLPVRRIDALPGLPPPRHRRLQPRRAPPTPRSQAAPGARPIQNRHRQSIDLISSSTNRHLVSENATMPMSGRPDDRVRHAERTGEDRPDPGRRKNLSELWCLLASPSVTRWRLVPRGRTMSQ